MDAARCAQAIREYDGRPLRLMEVCGTHTHAIFREGVDALLPPTVRLISGPGCPVCVTPAGYVDRAAGLCQIPGHTLLTFGDMVRVPGLHTSLLKARASGGSVGVIYSPLDALALAAAQPDRTFVVAAVGFETTLPAYALLLERAIERGLGNIRLLTAGRALMPALDWLCGHDKAPDGFIGPGHVSAIIGSGAYEPLCAAYRVPLAVAGFRYEHLVLAIYDLIRQASEGGFEVRNLYPSAVSRGGNAAALALIDRYFERAAAVWRGLGEIEDSGYRLRARYARFDAGAADESYAGDVGGCRCGDVILGAIDPPECPLFGAACTPENPMGPCMVSSEGACGIWHRLKERRRA